MPNWKEPHWGEGMLLLPQHLQASHRYWEAMVGAAWDASRPFAWGFQELVVSEARVRDGVVDLERCQLRTPAGTWIVVPDNTDVAARPLGDSLRASPDGMMVYLAVPRLHEIRPNASYDPQTNGRRPTRYLIEPQERNDENTGDNPRQIEIHSLQGQILFGSESNTPGFETVPMMRLYLSGEEGGTPAIDATYAPPLLRMGAAPGLLRRVRDLVSEIGARNQELAAQAKTREMDFRTGLAADTEQLLKLHVLNEALAFLRQWVAVPEAGPHETYCELCRLAGQLSVFSPDRTALQYPTYDHYLIGENFALLCDHVHELLKYFGGPAPEWRDFERREAGLGLQVQLDEAWLDRRNRLFVGVICQTMQEAELDKLLTTGLNWKIASPEDADRVFAGGLQGLTLQAVRGERGLPMRKDIKYYQIGRDAELWPKVEASRRLAIRYSPGAHNRLEEEGISFRVYVVLSES